MESQTDFVCPVLLPGQTEARNVPHFVCPVLLSGQTKVRDVPGFVCPGGRSGRTGKKKERVLSARFISQQTIMENQTVFVCPVQEFPVY